MIKVRLNGDDYNCKANLLSDLLAELEFSPEKIAIELNREIIAKEEYVNISLQNGDEIEIVEFVGGG